MRPLGFEWDEENLEHIARHDVEMDEAEAVLEHRPLILRAKDDRYLAYGRTDEGRYLLVVFIQRAGQARVITARDMTEGEKRRLKRRKR